MTEQKSPSRIGKQPPIRTLDGQAVTTIKHALEYAGARPEVSASPTVKRNFKISMEEDSRAKLGRTAALGAGIAAVNPRPSPPRCRQ